MSQPPTISQRAQWASGQPISFLMHKALANPQLISLAAGFVDPDTLPVEPTREALEILLSDDAAARTALQYGSTPGYQPLREMVLAQLRDADDHPEAEHRMTADQVVLTAGSNQMLHLLADTLFDPGDIVLCAAPTYFVYIGVLRNLGIRSFGVASDSDGMIPEALEETLQQIERAGELGRVKGIYVVSSFDNPSSATLSLERRKMIVEMAKRWSRRGKIYVIEDAAYRQLRYDGSDIPSLRAFDAEGDTVIFTQTFSKSFSPGVRVGWGILPRSLVAPLCEQKGNLDFGSPNLNQRLMAIILERGLFEPQLARICQAYRTKRDAMLAALTKFLGGQSDIHWQRPEGGIYVWLQLPPEIPTGPSGTLFDRALEEGVFYVPGEYSYAAEGAAAARSFIRLSYGVQNSDRITQGIAALARAIAAVRPGTR
jgi:2-aminoadipate transaminase